MNVVKKSVTLSDGRVISLETGALAKQADGAVVLRCGETMLLATAVARKEINLETDFLPLSVDYMEKFSAAGRFPGGFFKRDGRMGEGEILTSRGARFHGCESPRISFLSYLITPRTWDLYGNAGTIIFHIHPSISGVQKFFIAPYYEFSVF